MLNICNFAPTRSICTVKVDWICWLIWLLCALCCIMVISNQVKCLYPVNSDIDHKRKSTLVADNGTGLLAKKDTFHFDGKCVNLFVVPVVKVNGLPLATGRMTSDQIFILIPYGLCISQFQLRPSPPENCRAFTRIVSPGGRALPNPKATSGFWHHVVSDARSKHGRLCRERSVVCHRLACPSMIGQNCGRFQRYVS